MKTWKKEGVDLISDCVHGTVRFTVPVDETETTEKDLLDSLWVQRLKQIHQLQSAWWVYPSAEHTRFQHSIGVMHLGEIFAKSLYPSLKAVIGSECPSQNYIESLLRITGLLHDVGHGPFSHFFDENYLYKFGEITHEDVGQKIITTELGEIIKKIRRSPSGNFLPGEIINPEYAAFLIKKGARTKIKIPRWLRFLSPLLNGIFTMDNFDYVCRDAYMSGINIGSVNIERVLFYSYYSEKGFTLHRKGLSEVRRFLQARYHLYENLYYHRTTRAIDLCLEDIFQPTLKLIYGKNPLEDLNGYLYLTDWSLLTEAVSWIFSGNEEKKRLGEKWNCVLGRQIKWKLAADEIYEYREKIDGFRMLGKSDFEKMLRDMLGDKLDFRIDVASLDPRPENPEKMGDCQIFIYDPLGKSKISKEKLSSAIKDIPFRANRFRIYTDNLKNRNIIRNAVGKLMKKKQIASVNSNI
ncbi:MAG: HD domain-containing protein [bacterium]